jgi:hypothetical protein
MGQNGAVLIQLNTKQSAWKLFYDCSSYFNAVFFTHSPLAAWNTNTVSFTASATAKYSANYLILRPFQTPLRTLSGARHDGELAHVLLLSRGSFVNPCVLRS